VLAVVEQDRHRLGVEARDERPDRLDASLNPAAERAEDALGDRAAAGE